MAGFGKTVLAAEAVRDAEILRNVFPGMEVFHLNTSGVHTVCLLYGQRKAGLRCLYNHRRVSLQLPRGSEVMLPQKGLKIYM